MRLTSLGKAALLLIFLTLWNAANGGLNTLYMVASAMAAGVLVSFAGIRLLSLAIRVEARLPPQLFCGEMVPVRLRVSNRLWFPLPGVAARTPEGQIPLGVLPGRSAATATIPYRFRRRGMANVTDLVIELRFPLGLFVRRVAVPLAGVLVFPELTPIQGKPRAGGTMIEEVARPRRGAGDEFWGVRLFTPGEDARLINWRLSAKLGRPVIREFAEMVGDRVTIRVAGAPPGERTEELIREAASLARYFIDEGVQVRLVTDEGEIDFGRGLVQLETILHHLALLGNGKRPAPTGILPRERTPLPSPSRNRLQAFALYGMAAAIACGLWTVEGLDTITKILASAAVPAGILLDVKKVYPIPAGLFTFLSAAAIGFALLFDIPAGGLLPGLTHLVVYVLINRMASPKGAREGGEIALALLLLFVLVAWQTIAPAYFAVYVGFIAMLGLWLAAAAEGATAMPLPRALAQGAVTLAVILVAGALFAAMPRLSNPRFARMMRELGLTNLATSELSIVRLADRMTLGDFEAARKSSRRVMQVKISGLEVAPGHALYVRGGALEDFDGKAWTRGNRDFFYRYGGGLAVSTSGRALYERHGNLFLSPSWRPGASEVTQEFFLYPMATSLLFSMGDPTAVEGNIGPLSYDLGGTSYSSRPYQEGAHYTVRSQSAEIRTDAAVEGLSELLEPIFLALPEGREMGTVRRIAHQVARGIENPEEKAQTIERYFHERFLYSYAGKHGRQSLEEFLTETKAANCEYFATAMALMLRSLGVPARIAIGYVSTDWKQVGGYFDVRNSDAHAWVEAFLPGRGWMFYDPTPDVVAPLEMGFPLGRTLTIYLLSMQMSWYRYVIGYDFYVQQGLFTRVLGMWRDAVAIAAIAFGLGAIGLATFLLLRPLGRRRTPKALASPATRAWLELERLLSRYGFRREPWQTPGQFACEILAIQPALSGILQITEAYYLWRYAGEDGTAFRRLDREFRRLLRLMGERKM